MKKRTLPKKMEAKKWKKGQSGNPKGRVPSQAIRALKNLTIETYREVIELVLSGNIAALREMIENPNTPAIQVGVATSFMKAIKNGDYTIIERIAERIVGKIPDVINVHSVNTNLNSEVKSIDQVKLRAALKKIEEEV